MFRKELNSKQTFRLVDAFPVIELYDVGSLPFVGDFKKFLEGANAYSSPSLSQSLDPAKYFEENIVEGFLDKIVAGMDISNYPQFRDMNEMFIESMDGVEKVTGEYIEAGILSIKTEKTQIPEVAAIKNNSGKIYGRTGQPFKVKICVTGPYTLSSLFAYKDSGTFSRLGEIIAQIVESNIFHGKHGGVNIVAVDEPTFGFLDDPLLDYGAEGRENLRKAWETIFHKALSKGAKTCIHLHSTVNELFWEVKSLNIVESHVEDPIYRSEKTKKLLESTDKFLKASIGISDFDKIIRNNIKASLPQKTEEATINEKVAEAWRNIASGKLDPTVFLENVELMQERLIDIIDLFGAERVLYAGPECGLKSFPTYECALECLRRTADAVH